MNEFDDKETKCVKSTLNGEKKSRMQGKKEKGENGSGHKLELDEHGFRVAPFKQNKKK